MDNNDGQLLHFFCLNLKNSPEKKQQREDLRRVVMCSSEEPRLLESKFKKALSQRRPTWMLDWVLDIEEMESTSSENSWFMDKRGQCSMRKVRDTLSKLQTKMVTFFSRSISNCSALVDDLILGSDNISVLFSLHGFYSAVLNPLQRK